MKQLKALADERKKNNPDSTQEKKKPIFELPDDDFIDLESQEIPQQQIQAYAEIIGIKLPEEKHLLYIAKEGLLAQLPAEWTYEQMTNGEIIYINKVTNQKATDHPCDSFFRQKVIIERKKKIIPKSVPKLQIPKAKSSFKPASSIPKEKKGKEYEKPKIEEIMIDNKMHHSHSKMKLNQTEQFDEPSFPKNVKKKTEQKESIKKKKKTSLALEFKKRQLERKMAEQFQNSKAIIDDEYLQKISEITVIENKAKENLPSLISQAKEEQLRKEIGFKMMKTYMDRIHNYKMEQEEQYKKFIDVNQSQFDYKHINKGKIQKQLSMLSTVYEKQNKSSEENNLQFIEASAQVEKVRACGKQLIGQILNSFQRQFNRIQCSEENNRQKIWELREKTIKQFNKEVEKIINYQRQEKKTIKTTRKFDEIEKEEEEIHEMGGKLQKMKQKMKDLREVNDTNRSSLSEKQNKLFDLLSSRTNRPNS